MSTTDLTYPSRLSDTDGMTTTTEQTTFRHGRTGYDKHGCRCAICRAANTLHCAKVRARRLARMRDDEQHASHGTDNGYNAGCRCEACRMTKHIRYAREEGHRPHAWRTLVTETYHLAREAWETRLEAATNGYLRHRSAAGRARSTWGHRDWSDEQASFRHYDPAPTLRSVLQDLAGSSTSVLTAAY